MSASTNRSHSLYIVIVAALAGFAAVYFTMAPHDNADRGAAGETAKNHSQKTAASETSGSEMAAFVTHSSPKSLPDITFKDKDGKDIKLSDFKGRTILLNLWATWCAPCREEMPSLDRLEKAMGSNKFQVVALSLDRKGVDAVTKFLHDVKADAIKVYNDDTTRQGQSLQLIGMPTSILINADGKEVGRLAGPAKWDSDAAKKLIQKTIDSSPSN